jgi:hypothetical protein
MRGIGVLAGAAATAFTVVGSLGAAAPASASNFGVELNGTYRVMSNGEFAKTNEVYIDEQTVVQTWTMTSTCTSPVVCTGEVRSDQGWTAPMRLGGGPGSPGALGDFWVVDRVVDNWEPCPAGYDYPGARIVTGAEGTSAPGTQKYVFWGWDPANSERSLKITDLLVGKDTTMGPSGACGINKPLVIELPLRLEKLA